MIQTFVVNIKITIFYSTNKLILPLTQKKKKNKKNWYSFYYIKYIIIKEILIYNKMLIY